MEANRYNHSKLYMIRDDDDFFYIGSTTTSLSHRLSWHKRSSKEEHRQKTKSYEHFNRIKWNVKIILIKELNLENKEQLLREEDKLIQMYKNDYKCLNSIRAFITAEERIERDTKFRKEYYKINKEKINKLNKENYINNIDHITEKHKKYRENNKEQIKEYRIKNKERIDEMNKRIVVCICGTSHTHQHHQRHLRSKHHINFINQMNEVSKPIQIEMTS